MRTVTSAVFLSLDGVMQAPGGPGEDSSGGFKFGGWLVPYFDDDGGELMGRAMGEDYDLLLGHRTYDIFAGYWPYAEGPIAEKFNAITKYVVASPEAKLDWKGTVRLEGDVADAVEALKQGDGPDLLIQGSSEVVHALLARNLIDRLTLLTFPVVLGRGKRFFDETAAPRAFTLVDSKATKTGVVVSEYRLGGEIRTADFPESAEIQERARRAQEG